MTSHKENSPRKCMTEAWKLLAPAWRTWLAGIWPYVTIAALCATAFSSVAIILAAHHVLPTHIYINEGVPQDIVRELLMPSPALAAVAILATLLYVSTFHIAAGATCAQISHYISEKKLNRLKWRALLPKSWHYAWRTFAWCLLATLAISIVGALVIVAVIKVSAWFLIALLPVAIYAIAVFPVVGTHVAFSKTALLQSFHAGFKLAHRHFGASFTLSLLCAIATAILESIVLFPTTAMTCAFIAAAASGMMLDEVATPAYVWPAYALLTIAGNMIMLLTLHTSVWIFALRENGSSTPDLSSEQSLEGTSAQSL